MGVSWRIAGMRSARLGATTSGAEVTHINAHGFWLLVKGKEYFLPRP